MFGQKLMKMILSKSLILFAVDNDRCFFCQEQSYYTSGYSRYWNSLPTTTSGRRDSVSLFKQTSIMIKLFVFSVFVDLGSFQVFGIATDLNQSELLNVNRPVLVQPVVRFSETDHQKLLQIEFETNPLDLPIDYRVKVASQSLEIKYNAVRNSLQFL